MLKDFVKAAEPEEEELKKELKEAQEKLFGYQMQIKQAKLPVMVIFEGWGAAGKGSVIGRVIKSIDPRFFRVKTMASPTEEEKRYPFLHRYMLEIPEAGKFTFFDTYWMNEVTTQLMEGELDEHQYKQRIRSINTTERSLTDNGYLVMKFFFHISKKEQKKRLGTSITKNISTYTSTTSRTLTAPPPPGTSSTPATKNGRSCRSCASSTRALTPPSRTMPSPRRSGRTSSLLIRFQSSPKSPSRTKP